MLNQSIKWFVYKCFLRNIFPYWSELFIKTRQKQIDFIVSLLLRLPSWNPCLACTPTFLISETLCLKVNSCFTFEQTSQVPSSVSLCMTFIHKSFYNLIRHHFLKLCQWVDTLIYPVDRDQAESDRIQAILAIVFTSTHRTCSSFYSRRTLADNLNLKISHLGA